MWDAVLGRFVAAAPVAVMARLVVQRTLSPAWVDAVFAAHAEQQYTRELLFSTVVELMELVVLGLQPSLHAAAQRARATGTLGVSLQALYDKVNHVEPAVLRALVQESAARLAPVRTALAPPLAPPAAAPALPGYRLRIVDGNHLAATEKRVGPLRGRRGAAMPAQALVVYDPALDLVVDLIPAEDALTSERALAPAAVAAAGPGELWLGDRHFATRGFVAALVARGAAVLVREHALHSHPTPTGPWQPLGRGPAGVVAEQPVRLPLPPVTAGGGGPRARAAGITMRRIELVLDTPTEAGDTVLHLLTTLPAAVADAHAVAALYRARWTVEGLFGRLEAVLAGEVRTLGQPRAALLAFSVAVVAYNALAVVQAALTAQAQRGAEAGPSPGEAPVPISLYYVAQEVRTHYHGLLVAVTPDVWAAYDTATPESLAVLLQHLATHVPLAAFRKHPRAASTKRAKEYAPAHEVRRKFATARVLDDAKQRRPAP